MCDSIPTITISEGEVKWEEEEMAGIHMEKAVLSITVVEEGRRSSEQVGPSLVAFCVVQKIGMERMEAAFRSFWVVRMLYS